MQNNDLVPEKSIGVMHLWVMIGGVCIWVKRELTVVQKDKKDSLVGENRHNQVPGPKTLY